MPSATESLTPQPAPSGGGLNRAGAVLGIPRSWQLAGLAALFLGLAAALLFSGAAVVRDVSDPGAMVRWGLPVSKAIHNVSLATVIGGLIFAAGILPPTTGRVVVNGRDARKSAIAAQEIDPSGKRAVVQVGDIALPGTGEAPNCPVFIDGEHVTTLRGTYEELAAAFQKLLDDYVDSKYQKHPRKSGSAEKTTVPIPR